MPLPDISGLTIDELRQLSQIASTESNRRSRLVEAPAMVADILVTVHNDGGDYAETSASGLQMAEQRIAEMSAE